MEQICYHHTGLLHFYIGTRVLSCTETLTDCTVMDVKHKAGRGIFNLNTVNSLHSFIKETYNHYRGVATKYINHRSSYSFPASHTGKKTCYHGSSCCRSTNRTCQYTNSVVIIYLLLFGKSVYFPKHNFTVLSVLWVSTYSQDCL